LWQLGVRHRVSTPFPKVEGASAAEIVPTDALRSAAAFNQTHSVIGKRKATNTCSSSSISAMHVSG
jgi:hypothetical protein